MSFDLSMKTTAFEMNKHEQSIMKNKTLEIGPPNWISIFIASDLLNFN